MTTMDQELAELRALDRDALIERYRAETGRAPRQVNVAWLVRRLAWKAQERRLGGLSATARATLDALVAEVELPPAAKPATATGTVRAKTKAPSAPIAPGTTLTRTWHGQEVRATAVDGGFECGGTVYPSLTAVAKAVTGAHWNGRLFFGVATRKRAP